MDEFKFNIGDLVCFKHEVEYWNSQPEEERKYGRSGLGSVRKPHPMTIVERHLQQCHGGVQRLYYARMFAGERGPILAHFTDIELVPWTDVK